MNQNNPPAILLLIFNRPEKVRKLMRALEKIRPAKIYVSADGPRSDRKGEAERCNQARLIATDPGWPCEVITNFSEKNLGCKLGVSGGISWFFSHEQEGVILEDDCIPDPSFFRFCAELLEKYRADDRVMHINGTVFLESNDLQRVAGSYYFSRIPHVWGWATWARSWKHFDSEMKYRQQLLGDKEYLSRFSKKKHARYWPGLFEHVSRRNVDSWATPWTYSIMRRGGFCVAPVVNMVYNIGFDDEATHTHGAASISPFAQKMQFPLVCAGEMKEDKGLDALVMKKIFVKSLWQRIQNRVRLCYTEYIKQLRK